MTAYTYECEHVGKVFGCEFGRGLGCDRSECRNCGGQFAIWAGQWGIFEQRRDGQYYPGRALKRSSDWRSMRHELKASGRTDRVMIFIKDKVVAVGVTPLSWWRAHKESAGQRV